MGEPRDCTVLVVDDDFMVARIHRKHVDSIDGFHMVGEAHTGQEAIDFVRRLQPDIVLLDVYLPDVDGLQILQRLRIGPQSTTDVIVVTAARDIETVARCLQLGARHYLIKPFGRDDLHRRLIQVRAARRQLAGIAGSLEQGDVDRLFGADTGLDMWESRLPKGLSLVTMRAVVETLRTDNSPFTAAQLGEAIGVSRVSARRYVDHLVRLGLARVHLRYGEVGRPEHLYRWHAQK